MIVIVNGKEKSIEAKELSYQQIVVLANKNPDINYTVIYSRGRRNEKGSLMEGDVVALKKGMKFNVDNTTNA